MSKMIHQYPIINGREIHVRIWNPDERGETVICCHGLTQNSIDFLELGHSLAVKGYRVIAADMLGRGLSQWAVNPKKEYSYSSYVAMAIKLMDLYCCDRAHWVGTCMGGLIGLLLASSFIHSTRISSLILNDIGPEIPDNTIKQIVNYVQSPITFRRYSEIHQYIKTLYQSFGTLTAKEMDCIISASVRRLDSGEYSTNYDPKILSGYQVDGPPINFWPQFSRVKQPIMLMQGLHSNVLTKEIVKRMREAQPTMAVNYYLGCGHSPNLFFKSHRKDIERFLLHSRCFQEF